jgi:hypothetical protein
MLIEPLILTDATPPRNENLRHLRPAAVARQHWRAADRRKRACFRALGSRFSIDSARGAAILALYPKVRDRQAIPLERPRIIRLSISAIAAIGRFPQRESRRGPRLRPRLILLPLVAMS